MEFRVVAVGRVRDPGLRAACEDYLERAGHYFKCSLHETPDARRARASAAIAGEEAPGLLKAISAGGRTVGVTRTGRSFSSREFAVALDRWQTHAVDVTFIVGGAFGLHPSVLERCDETMSLSSMTMPHDLARAVLLEQLYRGGTILRGEPYHKGD